MCTLYMYVRIVYGSVVQNSHYVYRLDSKTLATQV